MGKIRVLSEALASQIAAGEVVERPASVVKELLENALDAGARRIDVYAEDGGIGRLCVIDDGEGMDEADALQCFGRHATSKLTRTDDLHTLTTFGFRGEALASIGSVAKVELTTRPKGQEHALRVAVEGGECSAPRRLGAPGGTTIDVRDLFFNVPARRKFLKQPRTEMAHVQSVVRTAALCSPDVAFSFRADDKELFVAPAADAQAPLDDKRRMERVLLVLGDRVRDGVFPFEADTDLLSVRGYLIAPLFTRRDMAGVQLSVNGRPVTDRGLVQAVRTAYRTLLEVGRQPICALDVRIDPALVDINVHPRKAEVRFDDARRVHAHLIRTIGDFLAGTPWLKKTPTRQYLLKREPDDDLAAVYRARAHKRAALSTRPLSSGGAAEAFTRTRVSTQTVAPAPQAGFGTTAGFAALRPVGQVAATYLLLEGDNGLVIVDQHAAHERVTFERLRKAAAAGEVPAQSLLFPMQVSLSPEERSALGQGTETLRQHGFDLEPFGEDVVLVRAIPHGLSAAHAEQMVRDALAEIADADRSDALGELVDNICARLACHASVRAGQVLKDDEVRALLVALDEIDLGAHCPHGRPVVRHFSTTEMARWFDRR